MNVDQIHSYYMRNLGLLFTLELKFQSSERKQSYLYLHFSLGFQLGLHNKFKARVKICGVARFILNRESDELNETDGNR